MQFRRIFQRGVGFVFLVVVDQTKRIVQVGDLADIQFINVATRSGGDIATPVEIADGHQGAAEASDAQSKGNAASKGKRFIQVPL